MAVKELRGYTRGRELGEVPAIIRAELEALEAPSGTVSTHGDEVAAARALLEWARAGDLVLLSSLSDRAAVLELVEAVAASGWKPGDEAPSI